MPTFHRSHCSASKTIHAEVTFRNEQGTNSRRIPATVEYSGLQRGRETLCNVFTDVDKGKLNKVKSSTKSATHLILFNATSSLLFDEMLCADVAMMLKHVNRRIIFCGLQHMAAAMCAFSCAHSQLSNIRLRSPCYDATATKRRYTAPPPVVCISCSRGARYSASSASITSLSCLGVFLVAIGPCCTMARTCRSE